MTRYGKGLVIAAIAAAAVTVIGIILVLLAPSDTSTMMKIGVFASLYGFMADIVVARVWDEFRKADLVKKIKNRGEYV